MRGAARSLSPPNSPHQTPIHSHTLIELADVRIVSKTDMEVRRRQGERRSRGDRAALSRPSPRALKTSTFSRLSSPFTQDYRRRYKLEPLVNPAEDAAAVSTARIRSTVDEPCVKCGHVGLDFYTMQLRSADEGSTVFYECRECGHKWNQNN